MNTNVISKEDMDYLTQQSTNNLNMILAGMTALLSDTDNKVSMLENQTWFQRMSRTLSGKNKMTQQEIQQNHDRINAYMSQAMAELCQQQYIDRGIIVSLGNQLNELYAEHIQLKQMLGAFVVKLNEKIDSIDNFHILNTEIEQGIYSGYAPIVAVCKILQQMDNRCLNNYRKMGILQRSMLNQGILNDTLNSISDYLNDIVNIPFDDIGAVYIELETLHGNFIANMIVNTIEKYHFLPDMARKLKNKQSLVESVIIDEQLDTTVRLSINDIYNDLVNSKLDMIEGLTPVSVIKGNSKLEKAEQLFVEYKLDEAFDIFKSLAEEGSGRAIYFLGEYYFWGYNPVSKDRTESTKWRVAGHDAGDLLSTLNFAYTLDKNDPKRKEIYEKVFDDLLSLAKKGDIFAQYEIADMYKSGYGVEINQAESEYWLRESADKGFWETQYELGEYYRNKNEFEQAFLWYMKAAKAGYPLAQAWVGNLLDWNGSLEKKPTEANEWYRKAVNQDIDFAMYNLGLNYCSGCGCSKDYKEAIKLFNRAAQLGHALSCEKLGDLYRDGIGVSEDDPVKAYEWYKKGAELGRASSYAKLGDLDKKVYQLYDRAYKWYKKAAELGDAYSMNQLALCYDKGKGVEKDSVEAFKWYKKAAEEGLAAGQSNLAICYKLGDGCEQDYYKAEDWATKAAKQGYDGFKKNLKKWFNVEI